MGRIGDGWFEHTRLRLVRAGLTSETAARVLAAARASDEDRGSGPGRERQHERFGATFLRARREQFERAAAIGLGAAAPRVNCIHRTPPRNRTSAATRNRCGQQQKICVYRIRSAGSTVAPLQGSGARLWLRDQGRGRSTVSFCSMVRSRRNSVIEPTLSVPCGSCGLRRRRGPRTR